MVRGRFVTNTEDAEQVIDIQKRVKLSESDFKVYDIVSSDQDDKMSVMIYEGVDESKIVAVGSLRYIDNTVSEIEGISVLEEFQKKYYGDFTVRMLLNRALISGIPKIIVKTTKDCIEFFEKLDFYMGDEVFEQGPLSLYLMIFDSKVLRGKCNNI